VVNAQKINAVDRRLKSLTSAWECAAAGYAYNYAGW